MDHLKVDLAVIGSGGAAFAAAIHATGLGKRVLMVERATIGGTCVNTGCIPSKALIAAAEARQVAVHASLFPGISATAGPVDIPALTGGKQQLVELMRKDKYVDVAESHGWPILPGDAIFDGSPDAPLLRVITEDGGASGVKYGFTIDLLNEPKPSTSRKHDNAARAQLIVDTQRLYHAVYHPGDEARYCLITSWESGPELDAYIEKHHGVSFVESYPLTDDEIAAGEALAQSKRDARAAALAARGQDPRFGDGTLTVLEEQMGGGMEMEQLSEA